MKQFILWQHTRLLKGYMRGFPSCDDQCGCTTKRNFSPFFKPSEVPCIEKKSFSKYSFNSSRNLWFCMTAMILVTLATKVYHQDFAKQNATVSHPNCRFSFKQMCKIGQIICVTENCSPDLRSVDNDVQLNMLNHWTISKPTVNSPILLQHNPTSRV